MAQFPEPTFRPAREDDLDRLVEIHLAAYPDDRDGEARRRNFASNPFGGFEHLVVAQLGAEVVAHAFVFPLETWFGGRPVRTGGIASVAVAPEARGRGVARALMRHLHQVSDVRGDALTMLYPFRQAFYASLGYAPTSVKKRIGFDPRAVPEAWRRRSRGLVRSATAGDRARVVELHLGAAARASGWITRPEPLWDRLFARERRQVLLCEGGYVAFSFEQREPHAKTRAVVDEVAALDDDARTILYGALGALRDQVAEVIVEVDLRDPIEHALLDADRHRSGTADVEHPLGEIVGGPMVRIEDVHRAIEARGYAADAAFDVVVEDDAAMSVRIARGSAEVSAARGGGALRASRASLAAVFYGGLAASDAGRLGLVDADALTLAQIDEALSAPPVAPIDAF